MKKASITEAKNNLSALIDGLKSGSPVLIMDRGRPVARLEPVISMPEQDNGRRARLIRDGILRPGKGGGRIPRALRDEPPVKLKNDVSVVDILLEERRTGR